MAVFLLQIINLFERLTFGVFVLYFDYNQAKGLNYGK